MPVYLSRRALFLRFIGATVVVLALALALLFVKGYAQPPVTWWYPFINSIFSDYYTTGPFAMTSNTREDNPIWKDLAAFNKTQSRLTYAMSRGEPEAKVAWLFAQAEWVDSPGAIGGKPNPNAKETEMSKALVAAGYGYDRISRRDLIEAKAVGDKLRVGARRYSVLLINNLLVTDPQLLDSVLELASQGVPVLWQGNMPVRASGWSDHQARDKQVISYAKSLAAKVKKVELHTLGDILSALSIQPVLSRLDGAEMRFRSQRRLVSGGELILLFNEHSDLASMVLLPSIPYQYAELLNPESGDSQLLKPDINGGLALDIPARRTRIIYFHHQDERGCLANNDNCFDKVAWQQPERSMHPYVRWWWPGNAVEKQELLTELSSLYQAGFGGVELQTLTIGFPQQYLQQQQETIYQVGSPAYLDNVKTVMVEAQRLGLTVDLTLGSGWSSGGPFIDEFPEQQLLMSSADIAGPTEIIMPLPQAREPFYVAPTNWIIKNTIGSFDKNVRLQAVVAAKIDAQTSPPTLSDLSDISSFVVDGNIHWQVPRGDYRLMAFYQNNSSHNVAASAYTGALNRSLIVDHLDPRGAQEYITDLGQPWLDALKPYKPNALFIDSFELIGELPWSSVLFDTFQSMHGYDVREYLPLIFKQRGESKYVNVVVPSQLGYQGVDDRALRIREDYELTREYLFQHGFLQPLQQWAASQDV